MDCLKKQIKEDFLANANYLLGILIEDSEQAFIPGGHNGPYLHIESPVRNTCHTLIIFSKCFQLTGKDIYREKVTKMVNSLLATRYRVKNQYIHRQTGADTCNGVIGDAWVIEALLIAKEVVLRAQRESIDKLLSGVASRFEFDTTFGYINRVDAVKGNMTPDFTYNHQLWFMASISGMTEFAKDVEKFLLTSLSDTLQERADGLINHLYHGRSLKNRYNLFRYKLAEVRHKDKVNYKERGYHMFNLLAFASLYKRFPEHPLFSSDKFKAILAYLDKGNVERLFEENNKYAIHYNSPGFELPYIVSVFYQNDEEMVRLAESAYLQTKELFWNEEQQAFINNNIDKMTFAARMYELSAILDA